MSGFRIKKLLTDFIIMLSLLVMGYMLFQASKELALEIKNYRKAVICEVVVIAAGALFFWRCYKATKTHLIKGIGILMMIFVPLIYCIYTHSCISASGADAYVVNYIAYHLSIGDIKNCEPFYIDYISHYTNNAPLVYQLMGIYKIVKPVDFSHTWIITGCISCFFSFLASIFTYLLIRKSFGGFYAKISIFLIIPMIVLAESSVVLYTDIISLWTVPASLYVLNHAISTKREYKSILLICLSAMLISYGLWNKPQVFVVIVSLAVTFFIKLLGNDGVKVKFLHALVFFCVAIMSFSIMKYQSNKMLYSLSSKEYVDNHRIPMEHFIAMGLNINSHGVWDADDVAETMEMDGYKNKQLFNRNKIVERLNSMSASDFFIHLDSKYNYTISSGDFTSSEIIYKEEYLNKSSYAQYIRSFLSDWGENYYIVRIWKQLCYVMMLCIMFVGGVLYLTNHKWDSGLIYYPSISTYISIIGLMMFIALFESNKRYFFIVMSMCIYTTIQTLSYITNYYANRVNQKS